MFQVPYIARQQYLAAQAEARAAQARAEAAQAEYLAQEALLQEEAALKARLYELEQRRRYTSTTSFAPSPHPGQYSKPQYPLAHAYASFSSPFVGRQSVPRVDLLEQEQWQKQQTLERLRMETEQDRLRKDYEAQLAASEELERRKKTIKAQEAAATRSSAYHACPRFVFALQQAGGPPCSYPSLRAAAQPHKERASQSPQRPTPSFTVDEDQLRHLFAGLFGAPHSAPTTKPPAAPKAPSTPSPTSGQAAQAKATPTQRQTSGDSLVDQLKSRYKIDNDEEIKDTILAVLDSLSEVHAPVEPTPEVAPKEPAVEASLLEQLQARSHSEQDQELRDTIQATLNSLLPEFNASPAPVASSSHSRSSSKARAEPVPVRVTTPSVESRVEAIHRIEAEFHKFEDEFVFPSQLDFVSSPNASTTALSRLAFTARNHPVRFYEQALGSLLTELDSIESQGDAALRSKRKEVVSLVERALETLEERIMGRWNAAKAHEETPAPASFSVPISHSIASQEKKVDMHAEAKATLAPVSEESARVDGDSSSSAPEPVVEEPQLDSDTLPEATLEDLEQLEESENFSPSESQLTVKPTDATTIVTEEHQFDAPAEAAKLVANNQESDGSEGFLLSQSDAEVKESKRKCATTKVEDLGSDWSDLDA